MRQLLIAGLIFLIMTVVNLITELIDSTVANYQGLSLFPDTIILVTVFANLYLVTTAIKTKISVAYLLPAIRTILWTTAIIIDLMTQKNLLYPISDLLFFTNGGLCLAFNVLLYFKANSSLTSDTFLQTLGFGIVLFAVYEFVVIRTATYLADKIILLKTNVTGHQPTSSAL